MIATTGRALLNDQMRQKLSMRSVQNGGECKVSGRSASTSTSMDSPSYFNANVIALAAGLSVATVVAAVLTVIVACKQKDKSGIVSFGFGSFLSLGSVKITIIYVYFCVLVWFVRLLNLLNCFVSFSVFFLKKKIFFSARSFLPVPFLKSLGFG